MLGKDQVTAGRTLEIVARALADDGPRSATRIADRVFQELTGIEPEELSGLLLGSGEMPKLAGARSLQDRLAELFSCSRAEASALLGASISRSQRNEYLGREMLHRACVVIDAFVRVGGAIGTRDAARWFGAPHSALDGRVPRQLLKTGYGSSLVLELVDALLAGVYA